MSMRHSPMKRKNSFTDAANCPPVHQPIPRAQPSFYGNQAVLRSLSRTGAIALLQPKCACGGEQPGPCPECGLKREAEVRRQAEGEGQRATAPSIVHNVLRSPGQPLEPAIRSSMEPRFGQDFSHVRIHTDDRACSSARAVRAAAYTVGPDIVFGPGRYSPATPVGQRLLAHELAHVVQQRGATVASRLEVGASDSPYERQADEMAEQVTAGGQVPPVHAGPSTLQRQDEDQPQAANEIEPVGDVQDGWRDKPLDIPNRAGALSQAEMSDSDEEPATAAEDQSTVSEVAPIGLQAAPEITGSAADQATELKGGKTGGTKPKKKPKPFITHIEVDLAKQSMTTTWSDGRQASMPVSTGTGCPNTPDDPCKTGNERFCTPEVTDANPGTIGDAKTDGGQMAWYVGVVDSRSIGIHNSQVADGSPKSHGCVRTGTDPDPAKEINRNVRSSTTITFTGKAPTKPFKMSKEDMKTKHYEGCPEPADEKPAQKGK